MVCSVIKPIASVVKQRVQGTVVPELNSILWNYNGNYATKKVPSGTDTEMSFENLELIPRNLVPKLFKCQAFLCTKYCKNCTFASGVGIIFHVGATSRGRAVTAAHALSNAGGGN